MHQVTLVVPDEVWERAINQARHARLPVEDVLTVRLVEDFSRQLSGSAAGDNFERLLLLDLSGLTDEQLLIHIRAMAPSDLQERLSDLQQRNNEGELAAAELEEFDRLLRVIQTGILLKAQALRAWKLRHGSLPPGFERLVRG